MQEVVLVGGCVPPPTGLLGEGASSSATDGSSLLAGTGEEVAEVTLFLPRGVLLLPAFLSERAANGLSLMAADADEADEPAAAAASWCPAAEFSSTGMPVEPDEPGEGDADGTPGDGADGVVLPAAA